MAGTNLTRVCYPRLPPRPAWIDDRHWTVLTLRHAGTRLVDVGGQLGVTRQRAAQLEADAVIALLICLRDMERESGADGSVIPRDPVSAWLAMIPNGNARWPKARRVKWLKVLEGLLDDAFGDDE